MIGNEGLVGTPVLLGADSSPLEAMVQIPGSALRMPATAFREEVGRRAGLLGVLLRYVQALHVQVLVNSGLQWAAHGTGTPGPLVADGP
jgi:hypothetical protein